MTEFFKAQLEVYFIENKPEADRIADQVLINKRSRETAETRTAGHEEEALRQHRYREPRAEVCRLPQ